MQRQSLFFVICLLFLPEIFLVAGQDNSLTFSPSTPLCVGDVVQMICYVVPPTTQQFDSGAALIAFNNSIPALLNQININDVTGVNTSRYTADVSGLTISSSRPGIRLTISPYLASDGATNFSCHGVYIGAVPSYSLISGYPQELAEPISLSDTNAKISFQILNDLSISVNATLSQIERNDTLKYTYTLDNDESSETISTQDNSYTFVNKFTCDVCYTVSYTAENCAGGSGTISSGKFGLQRVSNTAGDFTLSQSDPKQIEWKYKELLCGSTEEDYLPEEYFTFSLVNRVTSEMSNVTDSSLNLPHGFFVDIPQNINITTTDYDLEIKFIDPCFDVTIPINITFQFNATSMDNTLPIALGVSFGLLLIILLVTTIGVGLGIFYYKKPLVKK